MSLLKNLNILKSCWLIVIKNFFFLPLVIPLNLFYFIFPIHVDVATFWAFLFVANEIVVDAIGSKLFVFVVYATRFWAFLLLLMELMLMLQSSKPFIFVVDQVIVDVARF